MKTKEKDTKKNTILKNMTISLLILICLAVIGNFAGVFNGIEGLKDMLHIDIETVIQLIIMIAFVVFIENIVLAVLNIFVNKDGRTGTLATVISSVIKYASILIIFCWGLTIIGVDVSTVFASVGIVALILGFGAESLVADLVTGVFVLFENQFNKGDIIEVDGYRGTVKEIGIRTVSIVDGGGNVKIINHSNLKNIINRSERRSVAICEVGIAYETDLDKLEKILPQIFDEIKEKHEIFVGKIEYLGVEQLGDSAIKLKIIADVDEQNIFSGKRVLNKEIKCAFDKNGIKIPFPQVDVHTR